MSYWKAIGSKVVEKDQHERKAVFFLFVLCVLRDTRGVMGMRE